MSYGAVPITIVMGDRMVVCNGSRIGNYKLPPRKKIKAVAVGQNEFKKALRDAIRSDSDPSWQFG